jgi:multidrug efflux pump subunit AcrA (membrane-fusion protein)
MARKIKPLKLTLVIGIAVGCSFFVHHLFGESEPKKLAKSDDRVPVVLTPVKMRDFEESLKVQGNLEAKNIAMVSSRVDATIDSIFVDEGDTVIAGETKLFQIDSLKLQKAVEVSRQSLEVAKCAFTEKKANLERVEADLHKAKIDYERFKKLVKDKIVSDDEFERIESRYKQSMALHKHAKTLVDLAEEQQKQTKAALAMTEKDLRDSLVYAPISGKITKRFQEPGEMGDKKAPVLRIEDPSVIEVSAFLPAKYYSLVLPGKTKVRIRVYEVDMDEQVISYKSPTADSKLRTLEIKCLLKNPPEGVFPGAMAEIEVLLQQHKGLGVPLISLQKRGDRTVVFSVDRDTAHMMEVETGLETDGWIEIKAGALEENKPVVTMGHFILEEGTAVVIREGHM